MATVQSGQSNKINFRNIILIIILLLILMLITTGVAYFVARNFAGSTPAHSNTGNESYTYSAGEFLTNLSDRGYIKLSLVYLINSKDVEKELQSKDYEIRDKVFTILRSKNFDAVKDNHGMEELRKQIKDAINSILTYGKIQDVYFTSIIVN